MNYGKYQFWIWQVVFDSLGFSLVLRGDDAMAIYWLHFHSCWYDISYLAITSFNWNRDYPQFPVISDVICAPLRGISLCN